MADFKTILDSEEKLLYKLVEKQAVLRDSLTEKNWDDLVRIMGEINVISDEFQMLDSEREADSEKMTEDELKPYYEQLSKLRRLLLKCKIENKALGEYVSITRTFLNSVIEKAVPHVGTKTYSRSGAVVKPQPHSVVVNQLF